MIGREKRARLCAGRYVILLCCLTGSTLAFGGDKQYPLEGKVVAVGTTRELTGGGSTPVVNGTGGGAASGFTAVRRTYTVKSPDRVYVLECPYWMNGFHIHSPSECGESKYLAIGDHIHFRMAKHYAYMQTDKGKEQKLSVLSEAERETSEGEETNP